MTLPTFTRDQILKKFRIFQGGTGGLDSWLGDETPREVFEGLANLEEVPLTRARLNQLLTLAHEAPISQALFRYYWLTAPVAHPYKVTKLPCFDEQFTRVQNIQSVDQLYWGLYRFYVDALLFFGNIRTAYQWLRQYTFDGLTDYFKRQCFDTEDMRLRGSPLAPVQIAKDNRYLISEMACKSYDVAEVPEGELAQALKDLLKEHLQAGGGLVTTKQLLTGAYEKGKFADRQLQFDLSADDFLEELIEDEAALDAKINRVARQFDNSRSMALKNTELYLSLVGDLDVYVATSMRNRTDFRSMADFCEVVFSESSLNDLQLRYFDPTLSAAANHEDKGLIECLMVKCTKTLVLQAGARDSYGKDAEAAMALSLGKPVIIHADQEFRSDFFKNVHPLSRLINFENGVAIGAMVATSPKEVSELLHRIFTNDLEYELDQPRAKYLVLKEKLTGCVVRLQTGDDLLRETFWNHYHNDIR